MQERKRERERTGQHAHRWVENACLECELRRREDWVLSKDGQVVMALVWMAPDGGVVRVLEFAYFTGMRPPLTPTRTLAESYPDIRIGREPKCPGEPGTWAASAG